MIISLLSNNSSDSVPQNQSTSLHIRIMPLYIASSRRTTKQALQANSISAPQNIVSSANWTQRHPQRPHVVDDTAKVTFTSIRNWCCNNWIPDNSTLLPILLRYPECPHVVAEITNRYPQGYAYGYVICKGRKVWKKVRGSGAAGIDLTPHPAYVPRPVQGTQTPAHWQWWGQSNPIPRSDAKSQIWEIDLHLRSISSLPRGHRPHPPSTICP